MIDKTFRYTSILRKPMYITIREKGVNTNTSTWKVIIKHLLGLLKSRQSKQHIKFLNFYREYIRFLRSHFRLIKYNWNTVMVFRFCFYLIFICYYLYFVQLLQLKTTFWIRCKVYLQNKVSYIQSRKSYNFSGKGDTDFVVFRMTT